MGLPCRRFPRRGTNTAHVAGCDALARRISRTNRPVGVPVRLCLRRLLDEPPVPASPNAEVNEKPNTQSSEGGEEQDRNKIPQRPESSRPGPVDAGRHHEADDPEEGRPPDSRENAHAYRLPDDGDKKGDEGRAGDVLAHVIAPSDPRPIGCGSRWSGRKHVEQHHHHPVSSLRPVRVYPFQTVYDRVASRCSLCGRDHGRSGALLSRPRDRRLLRNGPMALPRTRRRTAEMRSLGARRGGKGGASSRSPTLGPPRPA
jgi:hypothetical protein